MLKKYHRSFKILFFFLIGYFCFSLLSVASEKGEIYPVFNGHWFVETPVMIHDFGAWIIALDGKPLEPPFYLDFLPTRVTPVWKFDVYGTVQRLGRALETKADFSVQQKMFQENILRGRAVEYEIHRRHMNSLEFTKTGHVDAHEVLGRFGEH